MSKKAMLLIMDGYGIAPDSKCNAISCANTQNIDRLWETCHHSEVQASGRYVGLPDGQMGNSEVGHTNMGAGRVVWQELSKISNDIEDGSFFKNEELLKAMENAKSKNAALHLMGLLSDGGVHSHNTHLYGLLEMAKRQGVKRVFIHCIMDGRDVPPACGEKYIKELEAKCEELGVGKIATIIGRFYSMDRDKRWDRVEEGYRLYTEGLGRSANSPDALMTLARAASENDEFIKAGICQKDGIVKDGDSIIFFNFRPDRAREITRAFVDPGFDGFTRKIVIKDLTYVCFTQYDATIPNVTVAFKPQSLKNTLGEYVSKLGLKQLRIAETEKYAHVTFFFNGGIEAPYCGEDRILVASPKVATYDLKPEMSAFEVTEKVLDAIKSLKYDLIIMNLANCDMVGHTGVFEAAVKAVETVDSCVGEIVKACRESDMQLLITADHGNADEMLDSCGNVVTSHSTNPVPLIYVGETGKVLKGGSLCDLAPTLLEMMELQKPEEMEGQSLLS